MLIDNYYVAIYATRRGLLEVWDTQGRTRQRAFNLGTKSQNNLIPCAGSEEVILWRSSTSSTSSMLRTGRPAPEEKENAGPLPLKMMTSLNLLNAAASTSSPPRSGLLATQQSQKMVVVK